MGDNREGDPHCPEYNALVDVYGDFCTALPIKKLLPKLISKRVIDVDDKEELLHEATSSKMVEKFIDNHLYPELATGETRCFKKFLDVMKTCGKCNHLVEKIQERINHHRRSSAVKSEPVVPSRGKKYMNSYHRINLVVVNLRTNGPIHKYMHFMQFSPHIS